jgi:pimeloyl-ACP methyl ester carboxylesterase
MSSLPVHYAAAAVNRAQRLNFASGAVWRYPATGKSKGVLLFIHGFRGNHHGLESIAGALPDWEIFIPDLPGFGATDEPKEITLDEYSNWLIGIYEQMPDSTVPIGHSFGTTVLARAMTHGLNPKQAVMINPIAKANYYSRDISSKAVKRYYELAKKRPSILKSKVFIDLMNSVLIKTKAADLRAWIAKQHQDNFSDYSSSRVAIEGFEIAGKNSVSDYAERIEAPVLLITGEKDSIGPFEDQKKLQKLFANSEFHSIPKLGHLLHYEAPEQVAKLIERFVD